MSEAPADSMPINPIPQILIVNFESKFLMSPFLVELEPASLECPEETNQATTPGAANTLFCTKMDAFLSLLVVPGRCATIEHIVRDSERETLSKIATSKDRESMRI